MVGIVSAVVLAINQGVQNGFLWQWLKSCVKTWPVAFPAALVVYPLGTSNRRSPDRLAGETAQAGGSSQQAVKLDDLVGGLSLDCPDAWLIMEFEDEVRYASEEFARYLERLSSFPTPYSVDLTSAVGRSAKPIP